MAGEIEIELQLYNHRVNNANACWDQLTQTTNNHMPCGIRCKDAEITDINFVTTRRVPSNVDGTPNAAIYIHWGTASTDTSSNCKWFVKVFDLTMNSTSMDAAYDDELTVLDPSNGQYWENETSVSLSSTSVTSGKILRGVIRRDATDAQDTLGADVILTRAFLVADQA